MDRAYPAVEFETEIGPDGTIPIPRKLAEGWKPGMRVTLRMTAGTIDGDLRKRHVTEEEIESIAAIQFEERGQVMGFLRSEGALRRHRPFRQRVARLMKGER